MPDVNIVESVKATHRLDVTLNVTGSNNKRHYYLDLSDGTEPQAILNTLRANGGLMKCVDSYVMLAPNALVELSIVVLEKEHSLQIYLTALTQLAHDACRDVATRTHEAHEAAANPHNRPTPRPSGRMGELVSMSPRGPYARDENVGTGSLKEDQSGDTTGPSSFTDNGLLPAPLHNPEEG